MAQLQAETLRKFAVFVAFLSSMGPAASQCRAANGRPVEPFSQQVSADRLSISPAQSPALHGRMKSSASVPAGEGSRFATAKRTLPPPATTRRFLEKSARRLPLTFTPNVGQAADPARFLAVGRGFALSLERNGLTSETRVPDGSTSTEESGRSAHATSRFGGPNLPKADNLRWRERDIHLAFLGANEDSRIEGLDVATAKFNYFLGSDPSRWKRNIPAYSRVRYSDVYPAVDMVFYGGREYDLVVAAGADPEQIRFQVSADQKPALDSDGNLQLDGIDGKLSLDRPMLYQDIDRGRKMIAGAFVKVAEMEFAFNAPGYDRTKPLIIDPTINKGNWCCLELPGRG